MSQAKFIEDFLSATDFQNPVEVSMDTQLETCRNGTRWPRSGHRHVRHGIRQDHHRRDLIKARTVGDLYQMLGL